MRVYTESLFLLPYEVCYISRIGCTDKEINFFVHMIVCTYDHRRRRLCTHQIRGGKALPPRLIRQSPIWPAQSIAISQSIHCCTNTMYYYHVIFKDTFFLMRVERVTEMKVMNLPTSNF